MLQHSILEENYHCIRAGQTTWYVDSDGVISLQVGNLEFGNGEKTQGSVEEETEVIIAKSDTPKLKTINLSTFDKSYQLSSGQRIGTITKVKFMVADKVSKDSEKLTDISQAQDKSVMAWLEDNKATLVIACKEKIIANEDSSNLFTNLYSLRSIENFELLDTSQVTNMRSMFYACRNLTEINLSSFDTSKTTNMSYMFGECSKLISLDLSSFNTSNVEDMSSMFGWLKLEILDLSNFDTRNVTNMSGMFANCNGLTNLDLSNFNVSNVLNMSDMFYYAGDLKSLNIDNVFSTMNSSCNITSMFVGCYCLNTTISIRNNVSKFSNIFGNAATSDTAKIILNYTSKTSSLVDQMIAQKSANSNVIKGVQI